MSRQVRALFALLVLVQGFSPSLRAQLEGANWFMGDVRVDFSSGQPQPSVQTISNWPMASISDANGNLLAAADTGKLYNAVGSVMLNGDGLKPFNAWNYRYEDMILPYPGHPGQYWLFALGHDWQFGDDMRWYASRFDVNAAGGQGAVLDKNIPLWDSTCFMQTAIPDSAQDRYWVLQHEPNTNHFLAFELNDQGLNTNPVVSAVGRVPEPFWDPADLRWYHLRPSPMGDRLVWTRQYTPYGQSAMIELFSFDRNTGIVFDPITIDGPSRFLHATFSPSGSRLYAVEYIGNGISQHRLWEYDVTLPDSASIASSKTLLFDLLQQPSYPSLGKLLLAPDGKVYVGQFIPGTSFLGVIEPSDTPGVPSTYIHQAVKLPPGTSAPLLPNTLPSYLPVANSATVWHERPPSLGPYPNPASDQVQVTLPPVLSPVTSFELRDATGRSLAQGRLVVR